MRFRYDPQPMPSSASPSESPESRAAGSHWFGVLTVIITLVGWSSIPLFLKHFSHLIDAWTSNGWRYGFSALIWAPLLIIVAQRRRLPAGLWRAAIVPSIVNSMGQVCFTWAHYKIDPGLLTFGLRSQILFAALGAFLLFPSERPVIRAPGYLIGMLVVLLGTSGAILFGDDRIEFTHIAGVALAIASGLLFAMYGLAVRRYMHRFNSVIAFAAISQYTALAMIVLMLVLGEQGGLTVLEMPGKQIMWLLISAVIGIALGHVFYYLSIARLGVAVSAGVLQLQPFGVAVGSYILFAEVLTVGQWVSGCVAVAGAIVMLGIQRLVMKKRTDPGLALAEGKSGV
ncbi:MAG: DMT family transporter [Phycisphaerales bacterium]|nr:MAG: DMT family transporter [Phycisphaerales bacterium]